MQGDVHFEANGLNGSTFGFVAHCPGVFRRVRAQLQVNENTFQLALSGGKPFVHLFVSSRGNGFLWATGKRRFIIKSVTKAERAVLLRVLLPSLQRHLRRFPDSLLVPFLGCYTIKRQREREITVIVLPNALYNPAFPVHTRFDLKGSTIARETSVDARQFLSFSRKDNDFLETHRWLMLGKRQRATLLRQLRTDAEYLRDLGLMDYSLLVGVHYVEKDDTVAADKKLPSTILRLSGTRVENDDEVDEIKVSATVQRSKVPFPYLANEPSVATSGARVSGSLSDPVSGPSAGQKKWNKGDSLWMRLNRSQAHRGLRTSSTLEKAESSVTSELVVRREGVPAARAWFSSDGRCVYFFSIIDLLQRFNVAKRIEHGLKALRSDSTKISSVEPRFYCSRFVRFVTLYSR